MEDIGEDSIDTWKEDNGHWSKEAFQVITVGGWPVYDTGRKQASMVPKTGA